MSQIAPILASPELLDRPPIEPPWARRRSSPNSWSTENEIEMNATPFEQHRRESFFAQVRRQMKGLYRFVRHQLAYYESVGDLIPGELAREDVVDTVLLLAYREFVKEPREREIGPWLNELATKHLESAVNRSKAARSRVVHLEEDIPETPPTEAVSTLGEEVLDFYQPDEDLKLEDIFPDVDMATPEEFVAAKEELLRCVNTALAGMPRQWRRALRLRHAKGLTEAELAEVLDKAEPEIERILEYARQHLRQRLVESGCTFISKGTEVVRGRSKRAARVSSVRQTRACGRARSKQQSFL